MSNSDSARIGALFPLMIAVGLICGAAAHTAGWVVVAAAVFCQVALAVWILARDDESGEDDE